VTVLLLSAFYAQFQSAPLAAGVLFGLKAAVFAIVIEAVQRIGRRALKGRFHFLLAAASFVAIFFFAVPFPIIIVLAGLIGWLVQGRGAGVLTPAASSLESGSDDTIVGAMARRGELSHTHPSMAKSLSILAIGAVLWGGVLLIAAALSGRDSVFVQTGLFFSKAAVVTFGGAYAVLAYVAQQAVDSYGWLRPHEMVDGLGLAETTPGPLILVLQFVGFLAAYRAPMDLPPLLAGALGALITLWVTFVPCFLWIFLGAPYIEKPRGNAALHAALSGITAAVVGVILNLSVWFGMHVLFSVVDEFSWGPIATRVPDPTSLNPAAAALSGLAILLLFRFHWSVPRLLLLCGAAGTLLKLY
jgi:chromate transporter